MLDEWQEVPEVLGAVKRSVDDDPRPGRFLLTGSVRGELESSMWPGTGRLLRLNMAGLTVAERRGLRPDQTPASTLERLGAGDAAVLAGATEPLELPDYIDLALRGGFPATALDIAPEHVARWTDSYVDQLINRDAVEPQFGRNPAKLAGYYESLALSSAGLPQLTTLAQSAGITRQTAQGYDDLLESLFVTYRLPAWSSNRLSRLLKTPKRYVVDPALMAAAIGATSRTVLDDGDLLGRVLDTFVVAQIRPIALLEDRVRLHHLRTKNGRQEIDFVIELSGGELIGIEIKASAAPGRRDARHLEWLRDQYPKRFQAGIVFHTGPAAFELGDRIVAAPISTLWA